MSEEDRVSLCSSIGASNYDGMDVHELSLDDGNESQKSILKRPSTSVRTLCLVGSLKNNEELKDAILNDLDNMEIVESESGEEWKSEPDVAFVVEDFSGGDFNYLRGSECKIYGPTVIFECAKSDKLLPRLRKNRPLFCRSMRGVVACLSGFRKAKQEITRLVDLIHCMGGSVRKDFSMAITHLITVSSQTEKYRLSISMGKPAVTPDWVTESWKMRMAPNSCALAPELVKSCLFPPFRGLKVSFWGFRDGKELEEMKNTLAAGQGMYVEPGSETTHLVVDCRGDVPRDDEENWPVVPESCAVVNAGWFWCSSELDVCGNPILYPGSQKAQTESDKVLKGDKGKPYSPHSAQIRSARAARKSKKSLAEGRSSMDSIYDQTSDISGMPEGLFSTEEIDIEGNSAPTKQAISKRHQVCMELLQTETNYVEILRTIVNQFKNPMESHEKKYLTKAEHQLIFARVPPILAVHEKICKFLTDRVSHWSEDRTIGDVIIDNEAELARCYPHFVNNYDQAKETLLKAVERDPKFNAYLKGIECKAECQRQKLYELLVRPAQRLPSMMLLLKEVLKRTEKSFEDHAKLQKAVEAINRVLAHINEDKRQTEDRVNLIRLFQDIEDFPVHLVAFHRELIQSLDVADLTGVFKGKKGQHYTLFLFNDVLEVAKKRAEPEGYVPTTPQPNRTSSAKSKKKWHYKHKQEFVITCVREAINVKTMDGVEGLFCLNMRDTLGDSYYPLQVQPPTANLEKQTFLQTVCNLVATLGTTRTDFMVKEFDEIVGENGEGRMELREMMKKCVKHCKSSAKHPGMSRNISSSFVFSKPTGLKRAVSHAAMTWSGRIGGTLQRMSRTNLRNIFEEQNGQMNDSFASNVSSSSMMTHSGKRGWSKRKMGPSDSFCESPGAGGKRTGVSDGAASTSDLHNGRLRLGSEPIMSSQKHHVVSQSVVDLKLTPGGSETHI